MEERRRSALLYADDITTVQHLSDGGQVGQPKVNDYRDPLNRKGSKEAPNKQRKKSPGEIWMENEFISSQKKKKKKKQKQIPKINKYTAVK